MRLIFPIAFTALFIIWIFYRLLIKRDLKQNLDNLYVGIFFIAIWGLIYYWLFK